MAIITDCVVCTIDTILDLDHIEWIAFHCIQSDPPAVFVSKYLIVIKRFLMQRYQR